MAQWYYAHGGQQLGPIEEEALKELLSSGQVQSTELVWREGMGNWQPASQVQEFATLAPATAPATDGYTVAPVGYAPPAGGYAPPGYGAPAHPLSYGGYVPYARQAPEGPPPPTHLVGAILATLFCCLPMGIVSIVYAAQVESKWRAGDYAGANDASAKASAWMWWNVGLSLVGIVLYVFIGIAAGM